MTKWTTIKWNGSRTLAMVMALALSFLLPSCYSFKDISIPPDVKTCRIDYIDNKARYVNPTLSPQLTNKLRDKVIGQTRLALIQGEEADYLVTGYISDYSLTTTGISNKEAASNRLNITVHIEFKNRKDESKNFEADVTRNFDFSASLSLQQAEAQLNETIIRNLSDEIFNRIFSNW